MLQYVAANSELLRGSVKYSVVSLLKRKRSGGGNGGRGKGKHDFEMRVQYSCVASWSGKEETKKYLQNTGQLKEVNTTAGPLQQFIYIFI